jgi:hypothetical protein
VERWRQRLGAPTLRRIGLCWAGRPQYHNDATRSVALERLRPLTSVAGVEWVSLQKQVRDSDRAALSASSVLPLGEGLEDFSDSAALISLLDLVISVDTAVAHLAGALGRPVWLLLPFSPDWRWLLDRDDSPWYPTARLFRQASPEGWTELVQRVVEALQEWNGRS